MLARTTTIGANSLKIGYIGMCACANIFTLFIVHWMHLTVPIIRSGESLVILVWHS